MFGQDVCGRILFKPIDITPRSRDICGRMMSADASADLVEANYFSNDFAGPFTFDISFSDAELTYLGVKYPFSANPVQLFAVLDTTDDVDKVVTRNTTSAVETDFVAKVAAIGSVETKYLAALDLSNYPAGGTTSDNRIVVGDAQYKILDASSDALAITITDLSGEIYDKYEDFGELPDIRDGSGNGSKWLFDQKLAAYNKAKKVRTDVHEHNLTQVLNKSTFAYDSHDTYIIMNWRDPSTNSLGYETSVKAFTDPSNTDIWGISSAYPEYNNIVNPGNYSTGRAFRDALNIANADVAAAQIAVEEAEVIEENALAAYNDILSQIANFSTAVKVLEDRLAGFVKQQDEYTLAKQTRITALVAAAADAKVARDSAQSNLAKARLAFFDASGNVLA